MYILNKQCVIINNHKLHDKYSYLKSYQISKVIKITMLQNKIYGIHIQLGIITQISNYTETIQLHKQNK